MVAAFLTENYEPRFCFYFSSLMGIVIAFVAMRLNVSLETDGLESQNEGQEGIWADFKRNLSEIKEAFKIKEFYSIILYLIFTGLVVPTFGSFGYYFMLDIVKLSKFTYSMLTVLGFFCLLVGT